MYGLSFSKILQESVSIAGEKRLSGGIRSLNDLLNSPSFGKLQSSYNLFCFLAFHPQIDTLVEEYLEKGSIASDSGKQILVLFIANSETRMPTIIKKADLDFGIQIESSIHPAYEAVETLFPGKKMDLPGLIFFDRFVDAKNSVYISFLGEDSVAKVASLCRSIFSIAQNSYNMSRNQEHDFFNDFCVQLAKKRISYDRTQETSFREWLVKIYNKAADHKSDILTVVTSLV
jgi:hypothetical protein